jgi:hypothetical protein
MRNAIAAPIVEELREDDQIGNDARFLDGQMSPAIVSELVATLETHRCSRNGSRPAPSGTRTHVALQAQISRAALPTCLAGIRRQEKFLPAWRAGSSGGSVTH